MNRPSPTTAVSISIYDKVRGEKAQEKASILDDLDFEIELISRDKINVSYIITLLRDMQSKTPEEKAKTRKTIMDVLDSEAQLRSKKELIERFIAEHFATLPASADVGAEFDSYWEAQKESALVALSQDEGLKREALDKVLANGSVAKFGDASKSENFILRPTHLDVKFPKICSCVAEILDNLTFQRPKRRSAKNKILQEKTLRQYPQHELQFCECGP
jgi:type I site-specific restriction-modification system R (restriction) subunit